MNLIDPIESARELEQTIITNGDKKPYRSFRVEPFYGQIATARSVGCNARCAFCWTDPQRDDPDNRHKGLKQYSPQEVHDELVRVSSNKIGQCMLTEYFRITGCEPTIGMNHLLGVLNVIQKTNLPSKGMLLETNGMILGNDEEVAREIARFREKIIVRLSFKAGTPEGLEKRTGVQGKFVDLPFQALQYLEKYEIPHQVAAVTGDAKLMPAEERRTFFKKLVEASNRPPISVLADVGEEIIDLFGLTRKRLSNAGLLDPDMADGKRFVYKNILHSIFRVLFPEYANKEPTPEEHRLFQEAVKNTDKQTVLQALDEADFTQSERSPCGRSCQHLKELTEDDNAEL